MEIWRDGEMERKRKRKRKRERARDVDRSAHLLSAHR
jgi:hypothetical protein